MFKGVKYRTADNWFNHIQVGDFQHPIKYLEIGAFYGANLLSVAATYGTHPESELHCIDLWADYDDYSEYKGQQDEIYLTFVDNINQSAHGSKIHIHRGYSHLEIPRFDDGYFDIIYVDCNHEPEYVLEDAVLAFRKLMVGGYLIFDDYGWGGPDMTQRGIDGFLNGYYKRIINLGERDSQVFVRKIR